MGGIYDSWILVEHIWVTFNLVMFKIIEVIWCTCLKMAGSSQKWLAVTETY